MGEGSCGRALFWRGFWGPILGPSLGSKMGETFINFWVQLQTFFWGLLELLGCLLGAFLGLLRLSWEASRVKKCRHSNAKTSFCDMQFFGSLKLLMALLGSSCPLLGTSGPRVGPKMVTTVFQKLSKSCPKDYKKRDSSGGLFRVSNFA